MKRRYKAVIASPLILIAYCSLIVYEWFVEGPHYAETLK